MATLLLQICTTLFCLKRQSGMRHAVDVQEVTELPDCWESFSKHI